MRPLPIIAFRQNGVFTTQQALDAGWTSHALRHAVSAGRLYRVREGAYSQPRADAVDELRARATAVSLTNPTVQISHSAAGVLLGLHLLAVPSHVCATYPRGRRGPMSEVHRHRGKLGPGSTGRLGAIRLTTAARTVLDIGHEHGTDAGIVAADSALRLGLMTPAHLEHAVVATQFWPGVAGAQHAAMLADAAAESPLESISRLRIVDFGLPAPELQVPIYSSTGLFLGRPDFYWEGPGVIGEADGLVKYNGSPDTLVAEKRRQAALEQAGLIVVRWLWQDLADFSVVTAQLRDAFARGLRPDRAQRRWIAGGWPQPSAVG